MWNNAHCSEIWYMHVSAFLNLEGEQNCQHLKVVWMPFKCRLWNAANILVSTFFFLIWLLDSNATSFLDQSSIGRHCTRYAWRNLCLDKISFIDPPSAGPINKFGIDYNVRIWFLSFFDNQVFRCVSLIISWNNNLFHNEMKSDSDTLIWK